MPSAARGLKFRRVEAAVAGRQRDAWWPIDSMDPELMNRICNLAWSKSSGGFFHEKDALLAVANLVWHPGVKAPPVIVLGSACKDLYHMLHKFRSAACDRYVRNLRAQNVFAGVSLSYAVWSYGYINAMETEIIEDDESDEEGGVGRHEARRISYKKFLTLRNADLSNNGALFRAEKKKPVAWPMDQKFFLKTDEGKQVIGQAGADLFGTEDKDDNCYKELAMCFKKQLSCDDKKAKASETKMLNKVKEESELRSKKLAMEKAAKQAELDELNASEERLVAVRKTADSRIARNRVGTIAPSPDCSPVSPPPVEA